MREILHRERVGVLGLNHEDGPYLNPNLFVYDADAHTVFLHGSAKGRLAHWTRTPQPASFTVYRMGRILPAPRAFEFSAVYDSLVAFGTVDQVQDPEEATRVLRMFMDKYAPELEYDVDYEGIREKDLPLTAVHRFRIGSWSGKSNPGPGGNAP